MNSDLQDVVARTHAKRAGSGYIGTCPCHDDKTASLSITRGTSQSVVVNCLAGCDFRDVRKALGIAPASRPLALADDELRYDYTDADGTLLYQVVRRPPKRFSQRRPDGAGGWSSTLGSVERVPYHLPEVVEAIALGKRVYVVEGEKDAETLRSLGLTATTNAGGANWKWPDRFAAHFRDAHVVVIPDNDDAGRAHADDVVRALSGVAATVRVLTLPGVAPKGDVTDWLTSHGRREQLEELVETAPVIAGTEFTTGVGSDAAAAQRARFRLLSVEELEALPEPVWLVEKAIPDNATVALVGPTKQYKTFVALDLAARISLGAEWHGRKTRPGPVVFIAGEGAAGLRKRLLAWAAYFGATPDVLVLPHSLDFGTASDVVQLLSAIAERIPNNRVALVIVDTLNRNMLGDENVSDYVARFMAASDTIRAATGATVLVIHHTGHATNGDSGKMRGRGSSAFAAAMDAVFLCTQVNGGDRVELVCDKQKDDVDGWRVEFEVVPVLHSLVVKPSGVSGVKLTGQRLHALRVLHRDFAAGGALHKEWHEATDIDAESSFDKARKWLQDNDYTRKRGKHYVVSESGKMALAAHGSSTNSTATPPQLHSVPSSSTPLVGGSLDPHEVEEDRDSDRPEDLSGWAA